MSEKYSWKLEGIYPVSAGVAAATINNLARKLNKPTVSAKELLDDSRTEDAPLHNCFTWDDSIAAEKYRINEAGQLIRSVVVTVIEDDKPTVTTPVFVRVQQNSENRAEYATVQVAMKNQTWRQRVLNDALKELRNFQHKYQTYEELSGVFEAIDTFGDSFK